MIGELTARAERLTVVNERLTARVEELERQVRRDSASSSPDSPYQKKGRDRSLRERGNRRPGKQLGDPGTTMGSSMTRTRGSGSRRPGAAGAGRAWPAQPCWRSAAIRSPTSGGPVRGRHQRRRRSPRLPGVIVRDGYLADGHLTDTLHAWCGAHLPRDLKDLYDFEPGGQNWAAQMAAPLIQARGAARDARQAGKTRPSQITRPVALGLPARPDGRRCRRGDQR